MAETRLPIYGGQAVIEGVMMRGKQSMAIAMRAPDNEIVVHQEPLGRIYKSKLTKIPFLRGVVMLWDALGLGVRALSISANTQTGEDEKIEGPALYGALIISMLFAIGLFFILPAALGHLTEVLLTPGGAGTTAGQARSAWVGNLMEGVVRLLILIGYIWAIGWIPDIRRVFAYHGAEHKTINAFEAGAELTPENVTRFSLEHPRCGTAFLLTLVILSILVFTLLGPLPLGLRLVSRIVLIPVIAGIAYEYIRWTASHMDSPLVRWMVKPNLALQRLTTREPNLEMLEVSIAAFNAMRAAEQGIRL
ncbi:MAG TPA: DUF1385 domain-containing protein [Anaerolineales bacterium]|nr:DUF1385 domain-containing protein [Anaerolineales bacterium]